MNKVYMIYYKDPSDPSFEPKVLKPASSQELAEYEIQVEKLRAKTDDEKQLEYYYVEKYLQ